MALSGGGDFQYSPEGFCFGAGERLTRLSEGWLEYLVSAAEDTGSDLIDWRGLRLDLGVSSYCCC
jgi:hypothetical protein